MSTGSDDESSRPSGGADELARRLSRVRHLYPFRIDVKESGRLRCELNCSPEELTPEAARELLRALEPIVERIRAVAQGRRAEEGE